jgi:protein-arginine kinase activator protein McsA
MKQDLDLALSREDYEQAAELRDRIQMLENGERDG